MRPSFLLKPQMKKSNWRLEQTNRTKSLSEGHDQISDRGQRSIEEYEVRGYDGAHISMMTAAITNMYSPERGAV